MPVKNSELKGFYKKSTEERIETLRDYCHLNDEEISILKNNGSLNQETGEKLVENYISNMEIPMGIATNFSINGRDYLIPMAIEEPSVIAACSNGARIARMAGGFRAYASSSIMYGQIQLTNLDDIGEPYDLSVFPHHLKPSLRRNFVLVRHMPALLRVLWRL